MKWIRKSLPLGNTLDTSGFQSKLPFSWDFVGINSDLEKLNYVLEVLYIGN